MRWLHLLIPAILLFQFPILDTLAPFGSVLPYVYPKWDKPVAHPPPEQIVSRANNDTPSVDFLITAYTAGVESTGKTATSEGYGITASGSKVKEGDCACDERYPFGTRFVVVDLGATYICVDRGGAILGNHIDIYTPTVHAALQFGKQIHSVKVTLPNE